jgi:hypothetical protein
MGLPRVWVGWAARESAGVLIKELLKIVLLAIMAILGTALLAVLGNIFQIDESIISWSAVWQKIWSASHQFYEKPFSYALHALSDEPLRTTATLVLISGYLVLLVLFRRARQVLSQSATMRALADRAGIGGRWPHAQIGSPDGAPWNDLCADIARPDNNTLYILGANGIDTFGAHSSPLYNVMQTFNGNTRVILCNPESNHTAGRAHSVKMTTSDYKIAISRSERRLRELREQHHSVEGRYYDGQPNWKLIITNRTAWVQYYVPDGRHVNQTPVWRFDATLTGEGLYYWFRMEFERVWWRCEGAEMTLH